MSETPQRRHRRALAATAFLMALLIAGGAWASETTARITAVKGGANVERSGAVGDDTAVETESDGNAALLVDQNSLVELCGSTTMTLTRRSDTGDRVISVGAGTTRIVVEPRKNGEQIQIHTPAAIATILGTVVYVTVDPNTGETTISSEDHDVKVESSDPNVKGSTTITGSEQVTIRPGEAPDEKKTLPRRALANLGGCLTDFRDLALSTDRVETGYTIQNEIVGADLDNPPPLIVQPDVAAGPPIDPVVQNDPVPGDDIAAPILEPPDVVDTEELEETEVEQGGGIPL